jgi:hypothetical protein
MTYIYLKSLIVCIFFFRCVNKSSLFLITSIILIKWCKTFVITIQPKMNRYKKNRLEQYLESDGSTNIKKEARKSDYELKQASKRNNLDSIDIDKLNTINSKNAEKEARLSRYEILERVLLQIPLTKKLQYSDINTIRSIKDKPIYTTTSFMKKYSEKMKTMDMESIEKNFVYDPKSKLVKDETKGYYNEKNGKFYRYLDTEGKELKELEDNVRRENIKKEIELKNKIRKDKQNGKKLNRQEYESLMDKRSQVLFANPTLMAKQQKKTNFEAVENTKRNLSDMKAKSNTGKKMNMNLLSKYK